MAATAIDRSDVRVTSRCAQNRGARHVTMSSETARGRPSVPKQHGWFRLTTWKRAAGLQATVRSDSVLGGRSAAPGESEVLAETYAGFRGEAVFPVERDGVEPSCSIEREGGDLTNAGFEDKPPSPQCPRLLLESSHKASSQTPPAHGGRHEHALELGRLGIEETQGAAADRCSVPVDDEEGAAPAGYFFGVQTKVGCSRLGVHTPEFFVQRINEGTADVGGQLGTGYRDRFSGHGTRDGNGRARITATVGIWQS